MQIRVFPPHYQLVYISFDISSFSLISYLVICLRLHNEMKQMTASFDANRMVFQRNFISSFALNSIMI